MKKKQIFAMTVIMLLSVILPCTTSLAASRKKIKTLELTVDAEIFPDGSIFDQQADVTVKGSKANVGECRFINDGFSWYEGDIPRIEVELHADDEYYFAIPSDGFKIDGGVYVTQRQEDFKETLIVTIDLPKVGEYTENIQSVTWETATKAAWTSSEGAGSYEVKLYRDRKTVGTAKMMDQTSYDFLDAMTKAGTYTVRVRPVNRLNPERTGQWTESPSRTIEAAAASENREKAANTGWRQDERGWWYVNSDGTYPMNCWESINGQWYYFDSQGYMATGWVSWNGNQYYCDMADGHMLSRTVTPDGFSVGEDGARLPQADE